MQINLTECRILHPYSFCNESELADQTYQILVTDLNYMIKS